VVNFNFISTHTTDGFTEDNNINLIEMEAQ